MAEFPTYEEMGKKVAEEALDRYVYKGKTLREWIDILSSSENTNKCEDCISRQAVLDLIRGRQRWCVRSEDGRFDNIGLLYDDVMFGLDRLPSVTPKQKMGHWIATGDYLTAAYGSVDYFRCSCCGEDSLEEGDFCPNCGAKMAESEETE